MSLIGTKNKKNAISVIVNILLVWLVGINKNERKMIVRFFKRG